MISPLKVNESEQQRRFSHPQPSVNMSLVSLLEPVVVNELRALCENSTSPLDSLLLTSTFLGETISREGHLLSVINEALRICEDSDGLLSDVLDRTSVHDGN